MINSNLRQRMLKRLIFGLSTLVFTLRWKTDGYWMQITNLKQRM